MSQLSLDVRGRTALITGASSGLGVEFARSLAARGVNLVITARREDRLQALAEELRAAHGVSVQVIALDLTLPGAAEQLYAATEGREAPVDILINNAGFGTREPFMQISWERTRAQLQLNVLTVSELTTRFVPAMVARGRGHILHVSSIQGYMSAPGYTTYAASKAYVRHFSEALSYELRGTGVSVTCTCPGGTATEFLDVAGHEIHGILRAFVAKPAPVVAQSLQALFRGRTTFIPGWMNRLLVRFVRVLPRGLHLRLVGRLVGGV